MVYLIRRSLPTQKFMTYCNKEKTKIKYISNIFCLAIINYETINIFLSKRAVFDEFVKS